MFASKNITVKYAIRHMENYYDRFPIGRSNDIFLDFVKKYVAGF